MTSQAIQGWHPNPQLMQPPQQAPPPQGWTGSWPPGGNFALPPGYPGPPPVPGGAVPHSHWQAGYWQYNPHANMQNPQQPWAPAAGWFPANFNPYKRVPKPPSPSYWNTKLSSNGLGLEGMVKRKEPSDYDEDEPHTPWIWNPPSLLESGDRATPARDFNRRTGSVDNSTSTPTRDGQGSRWSPQDGSSSQAPNQTPERRSSSRVNYVYNPQDNTPPGPLRHSSEPSDIRSSQGSLAGPSTSSQRPTTHADSWPRARSHPHANEVPPYPAPTPTMPNGRSASAQQVVFTQEPESFTSGGDLRPTFSSNIIRLPSHYQPGRRSTDELPSNYHSRSPSSAGHSLTPVRGQSGPEPLTRQSSLPNPPSSTRDVYTSMREDLTSSLNASTSRSRNPGTAAAGPLARSRTEPVVANLTTIHESSSSSTQSSGELYLAPLRDPSSSSSSTESSPAPSPSPHPRRDRRASPYAASRSRSPEQQPSPTYRDRRASPYASRPPANPYPLSHPSAYPHSHSHGHAHHYPLPRSHSPSPLASPSHIREHSSGAQTQPMGSASRRDGHNPLPAPPVERALDASRPPVQEPSPPRYHRKIRMGFWNRRGDHLTANGYVVYAPQDLAYPDELKDYPGEREGYLDQYGTVAAWREERPELPTSLPFRGRPPQQPYETFVVYTYQQ